MSTYEFFSQEAVEACGFSADIADRIRTALRRLEGDYKVTTMQQLVEHPHFRFPPENWMPTVGPTLGKAITAVLLKGSINS